MLANFLEMIRVVVHEVTLSMGYAGIFLLMLVENLFPPIPSEIVMPFAGFLAGEGQLNFVGVVLTGTVGAIAGALILYTVGATLGKDRLVHWVDRYGKYLLLSACDLERAVAVFDRHGRAAIFLGRLIPGVRSLISLPAGIERMPLPAFLILTTAGSLAWNLLLAGTGVYLGHNWQQILIWMDMYESIILAGLGVFLLFFITRRLLNLRQNRQWKNEC